MFWEITKVVLILIGLLALAGLALSWWGNRVYSRQLRAREARELRETGGPPSYARVLRRFYWKHSPEARGDDRSLGLHPLSVEERRERTRRIKVEYEQAYSELQADVAHLEATRPPSRAAFNEKLGYTEVEIFFATSRQRSSNEAELFTGGRGELTWGASIVSIPKGHRASRVERPSIFRLQFRDDPTKHVSLVQATEFEEEDWARHVDATAQSGNGEILVFVHGFNVSFDEAMRKAAQLTYDVAWAGAVVVFSWPSKGNVVSYVADAAAVEAASFYLHRVLEGIRALRHAKELHLVAHSMGSRVAARAIELTREVIRGKPFDDAFMSAKEISIDQIRELTMTKPFRDIVLAAADIDEEVFRKFLASRIATSCRRLTLYVSSADRALLSSQLLHQHPRVGADSRLVIVAGAETVDASPLDLDLLGHGYFAENKQVIDDLFMLLRHNLGASERNLREIETSRGRYWELP